MPQFDYKARKQDGATVTGQIESTDRRQAAQRLRQQKLSPISLKEARAAKRSFFSKLSEKKGTKPTPADPSTPTGGTPKRERIGLSLLTRLLELHASGLPVGDSIRILSQRLSDPEQKQLAVNLWRDLSEGATLAGAMNRQPIYFSNSITYVIEAGEATGHLEPILRKVVDFLEEKQEIRQKMLASMAYPGFICSIAFGVVVIFLTVLLPRIQNILDSLGGEMTWSARLLIDGSHVMIRVGPFLLIAVILGAIAFTRWRKTSHGRQRSDRWLLKFPMIGKILYYADLFQSSSLISTLLESGINTTEGSLGGL